MEMTRWVLIAKLFLYLVATGSCSLVSVHQPPVITSALGHDVVLQCQLILSTNENLMKSPVLYWYRMKGDTTNDILWLQQSPKYQGRVELVDNDIHSFNKSILLKDVQWADSGKYLCKMSLDKDNQKFRRQGEQTLLMVHDTMIFKPTIHNDSLLSCEVNTTWDPALLLSISHNGVKLQSNDSTPKGAASDLPYVTLSESVSVRKGGNYECQLHLNSDLITKSSFQYNPPGTEEILDSVKNVSDPSPTLVVMVSEAAEEVFPEPWLLYGSLLLVPITLLIGIILIQMGRC